MELSHAISQISEIHGQLAKSEVHHGYRPAPLVASAVVALGAAMLFERVAGSAGHVGMIQFWAAIALVCTSICGLEVVLNYRREDAFAQQKTMRVLGQLLPSVVAGAGVTVLLGTVREPALLLPGLWALLFGLGLFAARPYLPRTIGWVALFYLTAGFALVFLRDTAAVGWGTGVIFGIGQLAVAAVFYLDLEREEARHGR